MSFKKKKKKEREGGMNWESSIDIHRLPCVKYIASISLYVTQGAQPGTL